MNFDDKLREYEDGHYSRYEADLEHQEAMNDAVDEAVQRLEGIVDDLSYRRVSLRDIVYRLRDTAEDIEYLYRDRDDYDNDWEYCRIARRNRFLTTL